MKVAVISPIHYLSKYCTTGFQYCYSNLILENKTYCNFYKSRVGKDTVILDSNPILPRSTYSPDLLYKAAKKLNPTAVVLTSSDFDTTKTILWAHDFLSKYKKKLGTKFIGVLQGVDETSLKRCYLDLKDLCDIVALPEVNEGVGGRDWILHNLGIKEPIIYVGVFTDPYKELPMKAALGICTSFPLRLAYDFRKLNEFIPAPKPLNFKIRKEPVPGLALQNLRRYIELCQETVTNVL